MRSSLLTIVLLISSVFLAGCISQYQPATQPTPTPVSTPTEIASIPTTPPPEEKKVITPSPTPTQPVIKTNDN